MVNFNPTRRDALLTLGRLGMAAAIPTSRAWADAGGASLNFLAVGDWGRGGANHQREVAIRMGESAQELDARFVISVGDNFYEDGVTSVDDPAWQASFEKIYDAPSLQVPWRVILGNHDYRGSVQQSGLIACAANRGRLRIAFRDYTGAELHVVDVPRPA
jgi:acid phosphatase